jgi:catechol 2,3-dioxygenase-like lactoylglutathione lyase family enzyme
MQARGLVPLALVADVPRSIDYYGALGFRVVYAPGGEFRLTDPDGHVVMVSHT